MKNLRDLITYSSFPIGRIDPRTRKKGYLGWHQPSLFLDKCQGSLVTCTSIRRSRIMKNLRDLITYSSFPIGRIDPRTRKGYLGWHQRSLFLDKCQGSLVTCASTRRSRITKNLPSVNDVRNCYCEMPCAAARRTQRSHQDLPTVTLRAYTRVQWRSAAPRGQIPVVSTDISHPQV
jgi:hypothetical protein